MSSKWRRFEVLLDEGESEAIVLTQECHADRILSTRREANIENRQMNADQIR